MSFFFLMIRRPPRSTLFPTRRSSDLRAVRTPGHEPRRQRGQGFRDLSLQGQRQVHQHVLGLTHFPPLRSEEHTSDSSHSQISYAVFCLKKKKKTNISSTITRQKLRMN